MMYLGTTLQLCCIAMNKSLTESWCRRAFVKFDFPGDPLGHCVGYLFIFCTICCLMDEVSFGLRCKKSWHAACWRLQSGAEVRKRRRCQFCMAGSRGSSLSSGCRNLFTLRLADSRVAAQLSQLCRPPPDISGVTVLPPPKALFILNTRKDWTTARTLWLRQSLCYSSSSVTWD